MSTIEVKVPDIGDFKDVPVIEVFVKPGDTVKAEDSLVTLESDKATMDVPAPAAGKVKELRVKVGDRVSEGSVVLTLEEEGEAGAGKADGKPAPAAAKPAEPARRERGEEQSKGEASTAPGEPSRSRDRAPGRDERDQGSTSTSTSKSSSTAKAAPPARPERGEDESKR